MFNTSGLSPALALSYNMAGSYQGPIVHTICALVFFTGITSLFVSLRHLQEGSRYRSGDTPRNSDVRPREPRSLDKLHPEDVDLLYMQGIFSQLMNASIKNTNSEALLVLLPALEKFENLMVEESRKLRTALMEHDKRIRSLEELLPRQFDADVQNTQEIQPNHASHPGKARIKITSSKAQNQILKQKKKKRKSRKETTKSLPVDYTKNDTLLAKESKASLTISPINVDITAREDIEVEVKRVSEEKEVFKNETGLDKDTDIPETKSDEFVLVINETSIELLNSTKPNISSSFSFEIVRNETDLLSVNTSESMSLEEIELESILGNITLNWTEVVELADEEALPVENLTLPEYNSSLVDNATFSLMNSSVDNSTISVFSVPENTTVHVQTTSTTLRVTTTPVPTTHMNSMTTATTVTSTVIPAYNLVLLENNMLQLRAQVSRLERQNAAGDGLKNSYKRKIKNLEKNLSQMKRKYRKIRSRLIAQTNKISGLEILQNLAFHDMPRDVMADYEVKKAMLLRFDKLERRMNSYREMVIKNRHEIRNLKGLTTKQEQYIGELQAGSDRFEHKNRQLTASLHGLEHNLGSMFNSINSYATDIRWDVRIMLDRLCGDNHLHC